MCGASAPPPPAPPPPAAGPPPVTVVEGPAGSLNRQAAAGQGATGGQTLGGSNQQAPTTAKTLLGA